MLYLTNIEATILAIARSDKSGLATLSGTDESVIRAEVHRLYSKGLGEIVERAPGKFVFRISDAGRLASAPVH